MNKSSLTASEVTVIANGFAVALANELSIDDQNIWGNIFALIGASLLTLAAINQTLQDQSSSSQSSDSSSSSTSSSDSSTGSSSSTDTANTDSSGTSDSEESKAASTTDSRSNSEEHYDPNKITTIKY